MTRRQNIATIGFSLNPGDTRVDPEDVLFLVLVGEKRSDLKSYGYGKAEFLISDTRSWGFRTRIFTTLDGHFDLFETADGISARFDLTIGCKEAEISYYGSWSDGTGGTCISPSMPGERLDGNTGLSITSSDYRPTTALHVSYY